MQLITFVRNKLAVYLIAAYTPQTNTGDMVKT